MYWSAYHSGALALVATLLSIFGCGTSGSITHLIPDGYVGPVVIVFDDPEGHAPERDEQGGVIYKIPPNGVLRLTTPAPETGLYDISYFYVTPDGSTKELSEGGDRGALQVFAVVDGATEGEKDERLPQRWTWNAYVVGVPAERDDWVQARGEATSRAIGIPGTL